MASENDYLVSNTNPKPKKDTSFYNEDSLDNQYESFSSTNKYIRSGFVRKVKPQNSTYFFRCTASSASNYFSHQQLSL